MGTEHISCRGDLVMANRKQKWLDSGQSIGYSGPKTKVDFSGLNCRLNFISNKHSAVTIRFRYKYTTPPNIDMAPQYNRANAELNSP